MEDAHTMQLHIDDDKEAAFFAVFDGHGGKSNTSGAVNFESDGDDWTVHKTWGLFVRDLL